MGKSIVLTSEKCKKGWSQKKWFCHSQLSQEIFHIWLCKYVVVILLFLFFIQRRKLWLFKIFLLLYSCYVHRFILTQSVFWHYTIIIFIMKCKLSIKVHCKARLTFIENRRRPYILVSIQHFAFVSIFKCFYT